MKFSRSLLIATMLAFGSASAFASGSGTGKINSIVVIGNGAVMIGLPTHTGAPACASAPEFVIDTASANGKAIYALALTAISQGNSVSINGNGVCDVWADRETALQLWVTPQ